MFTHRYRYVFIGTLGVYSYLSSLFLETFKYYALSYHQLVLLGAIVAICWLVWEANRLIEWLISEDRFKQKDGLSRWVWSFLVSQLAAVLAGLIVYFGVKGLIMGQWTNIAVIELKLTTLYALRVNLFLQCLNSTSFFFKRFQQKKLEAEALKRISTQARLQAITSQINPHFLFNNLNVLSTLVLQKSEDANTFIESFSAVFRYILANRDNEIVLLRDELSFIQPYIYLLKTRFGSAMQVNVSITDEFYDYYVIPVALQLLVENAGKHNIVSIDQPLQLTVYVNNDSWLVVENNLQEKPEKPVSTGFGLENINQRYKMLTGNEIVVTKSNQLFSVQIPLLRPQDIGKI